jgi:DNA-binding MurR/RpiR family transcriptional regulator
MADTAFDRINRIESYATKQERAIIDCIRKTPIQDMLLLSITEFSEMAGVGDATMLRFCRKLGLKGYSEFRFLLSQSESKQDTQKDDEAGIVLHHMTAALQSTYELLDQQQIAKAADILLKSRLLYAVGSGNSGVAAQELCNKVLRYGINCNYTADSHFQMIATSLLDERDAMVLFSVSGSTKDILDVAKHASRQGVKLVVVTNYLKSPLAKYATALLYVVGKSAPLDSGSLISKVSQLYIVDVLSKEIYKQMGASAEDNLRKTAIAVMEKEV